MRFCLITSCSRRGSGRAPRRAARRRSGGAIPRRRPPGWIADDGNEVVRERQGGEHTDPRACAPRQLAAHGDHRVDAPLEIRFPARVARRIIVGAPGFLRIHPARFRRECRIRRLDGVGAGRSRMWYFQSAGLHRPEPKPAARPPVSSCHAVSSPSPPRAGR